jgi:endogenous inhibitor of DNA gyrase (YacG/DUF329 family)
MLLDSRASIGQGDRASKPAGLHHGNRITCEKCGRALAPKRGSRRQRFCSDACKFKAFRSKKWADRYQIPDPQRSVQNSSTKPNGCKSIFADRALAIKAPIVAIGLRIATAPQPPERSLDRAGLIRRAIQFEFAARWSKGPR